MTSPAVASPQVSATQQAPSDPVVAAEEKTRGTAQWLVGVFGALGAALIGGLSLGGLHDLSSEGQRVALIGFAIAIAGVLIALIPTALVLTPFALTLSELATKSRLAKVRAWLDSRGDTLGPSGSVGALNTTYQGQRKAVWDAKEARLAKQMANTYRQPDDDFRPRNR